MEPPLFIHFYASPLVYQEPESGKSEEIDELDFHAEQKHLQELLSSDQVVAPCRFLTTHCTFPNFSEKVNGCAMLHFTGHGTEGQLLFEDECGQVRLVSEDNLRELFENVEDKPSIVFVSACHSESVANAFIEAGVPYVISIAKSVRIMDKASIIFMRQLYSQLLQGQSVDKSFRIAVNTVRNQVSHLSQSEFAKFKIGGRGFEEQEKVYFLRKPGSEGAGKEEEEEEADENGEGRGHVESKEEEVEEGVRGKFTPITQISFEGSKCLNLTPEIPPEYHCPVEMSHFYSRNFERCNIITSFHEGHRFIMVSGDRGIGKTQTTIRAANFLRERQRVDQVIYISDWMSDKDILKSIFDALHINESKAFFQQQSQDQIVERLRNHMLNEPSHQASKPILCIIDTEDKNRDLLGSECGSLLDTMIHRLGEFSFIVLAERESEQELARSVTKSHRTITVNPMNNVAAAMLFEVSFPREFTEVERRYFCDHDLINFYKKLGAGPLMQSMEGNPAVIIRAASRLQEFAKNMDLMEGEGDIRLAEDRAQRELVPNIREEIRRGISQRIVGSSTSAINVHDDPSDDSFRIPSADEFWNMYFGERKTFGQWNEVTQDCLATLFRNILGSDVGNRPLSEAYDFLCSSPRIWKGQAPNTTLDNQFTVDQFNHFYTWFVDQSLNLKKTRCWSGQHPVLIHGFLNRRSAESLLHNRPAGTFLIRLSESQPSLVVSFTRVGSSAIQHVVVEVNHDLSDSFPFHTKIDEKWVHYQTLSALVLDNGQLATLHPHHAKEDVF